MKRNRVLLLVLLGVINFPQYAWADAGTPLMWAGILHLIFGNALIGAAEGLLLGWLFAVPKRKGIPAMILANYTSAWIGGFFIGGAIARAVPMDLNNGWMWFWIMVLVTYCITLVLEWPFFAWCFRGTQDWLKRGMRATLLLVSASYIVLFGWYWMASGTSLYTKTHIVAPADLSLPASVVVDFIAPADGNVYKRQLAGGSAQKVYDLHSTDADDRLFVRPSTPDKTRWDLVARLETKVHSSPLFVDVLTNLPVEAAPDWRSTEIKPPEYESTWFNFGKVPSLGSATSSQWEFRTGFWPLAGLHASNKVTNEQEWFSYETLFGAWTVRNAVLLPSDKVLFQLGADQICAFDPVTRRVALLWHGRGPVPVILKANVLVK